MDPVPALGEHTDAILAELGYRCGRRSPRCAPRRPSDDALGLADELPAHLPVRAGQSARALRQGAGERRRRGRARPGGRGGRRRQGRGARDAIARLVRPRPARPSARASSCASTTLLRRGSPTTCACSRDAGLAAVMLPKAEAAEEVGAVRAAVPQASVLALVESARGVAQVDAVAAAAGVVRLAFGTLDYALDLGPRHHGRAQTRSPTPRAGSRSRRASPGSRRRWPASRRNSTTRRACWPTLPGRARYGFGAKLCIHPKQVAADPRRAARRAPQDLDWARRVLRRRSGVARRRPARRPDGRPPRRSCRRSARCSAPVTELPLSNPWSNTPWPPPSSTPRIFQGIFSSDAMRQVWSDENRTAEVPRHRSRAGPRPGPPRPDPAGGGRRDRQPLPARPDRHGQAAPADRAHRLPDPRRRLAAQRAVPRQARRILPLGRDHAGHHRHRDGAADPRGARRSSTRELAAISAAHGQAREDAPRHADDRPQQPAAGDSGDLRLQDGRPAVGRSNATASGSRSCAPRVLVGEFAGAAGTLASLRDRRDGDAGRRCAPSSAWASR